MAKNIVITVGHLLDVTISKQPKATEDTFSPQATKAYEKGLLHIMPLSMDEKANSPAPLAFAEADPSGGYLESSMLKDSPQTLVSKDDFIRKWFPIEDFLSWCHLEPEDRPSIPKFCVLSSFQHTTYRVCELDNKEEASEFIETTAKGIKNALGRIASEDPLRTASLAQLSEFQVVKGVRVLVFKQPDLAINLFGYNMWWHHDNLIFAVASGEKAPNLNRERIQLILPRNIEEVSEYQRGLFLLNVCLSNLNRLRMKPKEITVQTFDQWIWAFKETTPRIALERKSTFVLPRFVSGVEATFFNFLEIRAKPKHAGLKFLMPSSPPKEVYAATWEEGFLHGDKRILADNSRLFDAKDRLGILTDAFVSGPPVAFATVRYGSDIAASMLFFKKDFDGPLQSNEVFRKDESKTSFVNTLRNKYCVVNEVSFAAIEHDDTDDPTRNIFGTFKMNIHVEGSKIEYAWIWPDEFGVYFLDVIQDVGSLSCNKCGKTFAVIPENGRCDTCGSIIGHTVGREISNLLRIEQERAKKAGAGKKEEVRILLGKSNFFSRLMAKYLYKEGAWTRNVYENAVAGYDKIDALLSMDKDKK